jgi:prepilin peptidase CpaA
MLGTVLDATLVILVLVAAWTDLRSRRVPNALTVSGFLLALALRVPLGTSAVLDGLLAAAIAFGLALPVFALGGLGGGDVKLLAAVGAFLGVERLWGALFVAVLVGGALAIISVLRRGKAPETLANLYILIKGLARKESYTGWKGEEGDAPLTIRSAGVVTRPFAVAIAAGAIYAVFPIFY